MNFHSAYEFPREDKWIHQKLADYCATAQIDGIQHQTTHTKDQLSTVYMTLQKYSQ